MKRMMIMMMMMIMIIIIIIIINFSKQIAVILLTTRPWSWLNCQQNAFSRPPPQCSQGSFSMQNRGYTTCKFRLVPLCLVNHLQLWVLCKSGRSGCVQPMHASLNSGKTGRFKLQKLDLFTALSMLYEIIHTVYMCTAHMLCTSTFPI